MAKNELIDTVARMIMPDAFVDYRALGTPELIDDQMTLMIQWQEQARSRARQVIEFVESARPCADQR